MTAGSRLSLIQRGSCHASSESSARGHCGAVHGTLDTTLPQGACDTLDVVPPHRRRRSAGGRGHDSGHWQTWSASVKAEVNAWLTAQLDKRRKTPSRGQQPQP